MKITLGERFQKFVQPRADGCQIWMGALQGAYGVISIDGKLKLAHRVAVKLDGRKLPDDLCVRHICKTKSCVNPEHLQVGTLKENQADRHRDGTSNRKKLWIKPSENLNTAENVNTISNGVSTEILG
tara:strand:+ start:9 stop:389 length:381 start_codon:yes stop_codon:yes gene_type:complete